MGSIGENIKYFREKAGLSQNQLAHRIGKARSSISQYESGKITPRMGAIEDIARALGCTKLDLIGSYVEYHLMKMPITPLDALTDEERRLLDAFRRLDASARQMALAAVEGMAAV